MNEQVLHPLPEPAADLATLPTEPMPSPRWGRSDSAILGLLLVLALGHGLLVATIQWPWYAPDEQDHVEYSLLILRYGPTVTRDQIDPDLRQEIAQSLYRWSVFRQLPEAGSDPRRWWTGEVGRQPALYYLLAAGPAALAPGDLVAQLQAMRLVSVALGSVTIGLLFVAGRWLAPGRPDIGLGLAGVGLFSTANGILNGAVTNDSLAIAAGTFLLTLVVGIGRAAIDQRRSRWLLLGLVAACLLLFLSKRTALALLPVGLIALALVGTGHLRALPPALRWPIIGGLIGAGLLVVLSAVEIGAGGLLLRPWVLALVQRLIEYDLTAVFGTTEGSGDAPTSGEEWRVRIWEPLLISLWGRFGRVAELTLPIWWYAIHAIVFSTAVLGCLLTVGRGLIGWRRHRPWLVVHGLLTIAGLGSAAVTILPYAIGLYAGYPLARFFLPALLPLTLVYATGLVLVWPRAWQGPALFIMLAILAWLDAYVLFYALPTHYSIGNPRLP